MIFLLGSALSIIPKSATALWWPTNLGEEKCVVSTFNVDENGNEIPGTDQETGAWYWCQDVTGQVCQCYHDFGGGWYIDCSGDD